ncbi:MAG TPA: baseplate J/gp47 family protein [Polyangiaceae bacterium]
MADISVFSLIVRQTAADFYAAALELAELVGLPVSTWRTGDPTRTMLRADADAFETLDGVQAELAASAFLETATGDWLTLRAKDVYGVERQEATFATSSVTLANAGGGLFELAPGGLILKNETTGATFTNQSTVTINPLAGSTVVSVVAQEAGVGGNSAEDEIDTIVSPTMIGVTISTSTAAVDGADEQSDEDLREQCLATLGSLSPAGPADAYEFVAGNADLTGIAGVTRRKASGDNATGTVTVYVATATSGLDAPSVAAIQSAVDRWATPLAILATVQSGTPVPVNVTLNLTPNLPAMQAVVESAAASYFAGVDFGGTIAPDAVASAARVAIVAAGGTVTIVDCSAPTLQTLAANEFPIRGTVTLS